MIAHFYESITGWFDWPSLYREAVSAALIGAHFVEVGAWLGKSTAFLAVEIANSGNPIQLDVVDTWDGTPGDVLMQHWMNKHPEGPYGHFLESMRRGGVQVQFLDEVIEWGGVHPLRMSSIRAAELYADQSLDFVFIDAAHDYASVKADVLAWLPKVKAGGTLAGHDYSNEPGVQRAVDELLPHATIHLPEVEDGWASWSCLR